MIRLLFALWLCCAAFAVPAQPHQSEEETTAIVPRYLLQDPNGRAITNEDFLGRFQLIAFGYTYCPDICPTTLVEMAEILKQLDGDASKLQAIFISVDPERDTVQVLKTYTTFFDPRIVGLTGSPALVKRAADNFRIRYAKVREPGKPADQYAVDHSAGMILLGPDGRFLRKFAFAMPVEEISSEIKGLIHSY